MSAQEGSSGSSTDETELDQLLQNSVEESQESSSLLAVTDLLGFCHQIPFLHMWQPWVSYVRQRPVFRGTLLHQVLDFGEFVPKIVSTLRA